MSSEGIRNIDLHPLATGSNDAIYMTFQCPKPTPEKEIIVEFTKRMESESHRRRERQMQAEFEKAARDKMKEEEEIRACSFSPQITPYSMKKERLPLTSPRSLAPKILTSLLVPEPSSRRSSMNHQSRVMRQNVPSPYSQVELRKSIPRQRQKGDEPQGTVVAFGRTSAYSSSSTVNKPSQMKDMHRSPKEQSLAELQGILSRRKEKRGNKEGSDQGHPLTSPSDQCLAENRVNRDGSQGKRQHTPTRSAGLHRRTPVVRKQHGLPKTTPFEPKDKVVKESEKVLLHVSSDSKEKHTFLLCNTNDELDHQNSGDHNAPPAQLSNPKGLCIETDGEAFNHRPQSKSPQPITNSKQPSGDAHPPKTSRIFTAKAKATAMLTRIVTEHKNKGKGRINRVKTETDGQSLEEYVPQSHGKNMTFTPTSYKNSKQITTPKTRLSDDLRKSQLEEIMRQKASSIVTHKLPKKNDGYGKREEEQQRLQPEVVYHDSHSLALLSDFLSLKYTPTGQSMHSQNIIQPGVSQSAQDSLFTTFLKRISRHPVTQK